MSYRNPSEAEATFYNAILEDAVGQHVEEVNTLIADYFENDAIALTIGLASGEYQLRPSFVEDADGNPTADIRVEFGKPDEHETYTIIHTNEGENHAES